MINLETYKSRIASFSSDCQHCLKRNKGSHFERVQKGSFSFKILFLIIFTLSRICVSQDPSVAKNPGPYTPRPFIYESTQERKLFLQLRELNNNLITITSHRTFLQNCLNNEVIPYGITKDFLNAIAKPDANLLYKLEMLEQNNSFTYMNKIISHYEIKISKLKENIQVTLNDLSTITKPDHYDFLLKCQETFTKKNSEKLNFIKSKKT